MSTPTGESRVSRAAGRRWGVPWRAARRGWYWAADYRYIVRHQGAGLADPAVPAAYAAGDRAPVVLIAGVMEPWTLLRPAADMLSADGHPIHVVLDLAYNLAAVPEASDLVAGEIQERDLRHVILVTHSKGGLIGKHVLAHDTEGRVDRLIAIATPFAGSTLARFVPLTSIQALRPTDETILGLAAHETVNARITSIYPEFDPHVPDGSHLDGATNVALPVIGHFRILSDPLLLDAVAAAAGKQGPAAG